MVKGPCIFKKTSHQENQPFSLNPPFYSKKRARDSDDEEARAPKSRYKHAIDVDILQAKLNPKIWKNIPSGENELDARICVGSGTKILTDAAIYNDSVDSFLSRLDVEEDDCVAKGSEK